MIVELLICELVLKSDLFQKNGSMDLKIETYWWFKMECFIGSVNEQRVMQLSYVKIFICIQ